MQVAASMLRHCSSACFRQESTCMRTILLAATLSIASAFSFPPVLVEKFVRHGASQHHRHLPNLPSQTYRPGRPLSLTLRAQEGNLAALPAPAQQLKTDLLDSCTKFKDAQLQMWKAEAEASESATEKKDRLGGILGAESLGVVMLEVGELGNETLALARKLSKYNPTVQPLNGWQGFGNTQPSACKMGGKWKKLFTTAADATFKPTERRGNATVTQDVDPEQGVFTNIITFDGTKNKVREFRVKINGIPESGTDVSLDFRRIILLRRSKLPWLLGKITIPLPRRSVINAIARWGSRGKAKAAPKALIQMQYLDDDLWIHKTGESNWFIQRRIGGLNTTLLHPSQG